MYLTRAITGIINAAVLCINFITILDHLTSLGVLEGSNKMVFIGIYFCTFLIYEIFEIQFVLATNAFLKSSK